jgi:hypothetical protein
MTRHRRKRRNPEYNFPNIAATWSNHGEDVKLRDLSGKGYYIGVGGWDWSEWLFKRAESHRHLRSGVLMQQYIIVGPFEAEDDAREWSKWARSPIDFEFKGRYDEGEMASSAQDMISNYGGGQIVWISPTEDEYGDVEYDAVTIFNID